jgi:hypothetical protein
MQARDDFDGYVQGALGNGKGFGADFTDSVTRTFTGPVRFDPSEDAEETRNQTTS